MKKRIMVHLSSNWGTSNFGDVLFAEMIVEHLVKMGFDVSLFDASAYVKEYLYKKQGLPNSEFSLSQADACLYFAGGYFGERKTKIVLHLIHFHRFMRFGLYAKLKRKPIGVIGIGAGDYLWPLNRIVVKDVCRRAAVITTRDIESTRFLHGLLPGKDIVTCSDIAQTIEAEKYRGKKVDGIDETHRYIFLHVNNNQNVNHLFVDGIKRFILKHHDFKVIIGNDILPNDDSNYEYAVKTLGPDRVIYYKYSWPDELCSVIAKCDVVVTFKLHVGIIASTLGCSVLSFSKHEKIPRYYSQIQCPERCIPFDSADPEVVDIQLESFWNDPVSIPPSVMDLANDNWSQLDHYLETI